MALSAFIAGCSGPTLTSDERAFFRAARPCGFILFARNCESPGQVRALIGDVREAVGSEQLFVLVDQEGGRVQRLKPPHWRAYPPAAAFGRLFQADAARGLQAARASAQLMATELAGLGINVDCAPVLDVPVPGAHDIIGDRAYGRDPDTVIALGRAVADGLMAGGVLPVVKHMPGHGRAGADSHASLPVITASPEELEASDFRPFVALRDLPLAMTAHVLIPAYDAERSASVSEAIISQVIRGLIGFDGLVMSDDLSMGALSGSLDQRAAGVIAAGVDVALHCNGKLAEMEQVAASVPELAGKAETRFQAAFAKLSPPQEIDEAGALALLAEAVRAT